MPYMLWTNGSFQLFSAVARGYRPRRGAGQAIQTVLTLLRQGYTDVVDGDLSKYFDTIPHDGLMQSLGRRIVDPGMLRLIKKRL